MKEPSFYLDWGFDPSHSHFQWDTVQCHRPLGCDPDPVSTMKRGVDIHACVECRLSSMRELNASVGEHELRARKAAMSAA